MKIKNVKNFNPAKERFNVKKTFLDLDFTTAELRCFFQQIASEPFNIFVHEELWSEICKKQATLEFEFEIEVHTMLRKMLEYWRSENMFGSKDYLKAFCALDRCEILKGTFSTILDEVQTPTVFVNPRKNEISPDCEVIPVHGHLYIYAQNLQHETQSSKKFGSERFVYTVHVELSPNK